LATTLLLGSLTWAVPAWGQTQLSSAQLQCAAPGEAGFTLRNQADYTHSTLRRQAIATYDLAPESVDGQTPSVSSQITNSGALSLTPQATRDTDGNLVHGVGQIATALQAELRDWGWSETEANQGSLAAVRAFALLPDAAPLQQVLTATQQAMATAVPARATQINGLGADATQALTLALIGLRPSTVSPLGIPAAEATLAAEAAATVVQAKTDEATWANLSDAAYDAAIAALPAHSDLLTQAKDSLAQDRRRLLSGEETSLNPGDVVRFSVGLQNTGRAPLQVQTPSIAELQQSGLVGPGTVVAIRLDGAEPGTTVSLAPNQQVTLQVDVQISHLQATAAPLAIALSSTCGGDSQQTITLLPPISPDGLIDPLGRITGCAGELLPDYRGFSMGVYFAASPLGDLGELVPLTTTEVPDNPNNAIPAGLPPNTQNSNPFFLSQSDQGGYNFLLDPSRGQLDLGTTYILMINPPANSTYRQRRIRLVIGERTGDTFAYTATSLDGLPISATDNLTTVAGTINIGDAAQVGLVLAVLNLGASVCDAQSIQIIKTGDRVAAEPGDTVLYRLVIRNLATTPVSNLAVTDTLPLGFNLVANSGRAALGNTPVPLETTPNGRTVTFQPQVTLEQGQGLAVVYAAQLTPEALRGNGLNSAMVSGRRSDNGQVVRDGPALHRLRVQPGIVADTGTIVGRVFWDQNFDGEQQSGEPGIPNAVIFLDDGTRITTDENGLFSVANVLPGYRVGTLDLTSIPGYTLAPNQVFIEHNTDSRRVQLSPGGLVRMNFGVMPLAPADVPAEAAE